MLEKDSGLALLLEDSDVWADLLGEFLGELGFDVLGARTLAEARTLFATNSHAIELVVADVYLGEEAGDGLILLEHAARTARPPKLMVVTSHASADTRRRAEAVGALCLVKRDISKTSFHDTALAFLSGGSPAQAGQTNSSKTRDPSTTRLEALVELASRRVIQGAG